MLNCTLLFVCGMTIGVTWLGLEVVTPKVMVLPDGSLPFRATMTEAPAGRVTLEIGFKLTAESNRRCFQALKAKTPCPKAGRLLPAICPCCRADSTTARVLVHDIPIPDGLKVYLCDNRSASNFPVSEIGGNCRPNQNGSGKRRSLSRKMMPAKDLQHEISPNQFCLSPAYREEQIQFRLPWRFAGFIQYYPRDPHGPLCGCE